MKIEISAPGKTILFGEHAVVYGKRKHLYSAALLMHGDLVVGCTEAHKFCWLHWAAIAVSLSLRTRLTLVSSNDNKVVIDLKNSGLRREWDLNDLLTCNISSSELGTGTIVSYEDCVKTIAETFLLSDHSESDKLSLITFLYLWIHISKSYNFGNFPSCHISIDSDLGIGSGMGSSSSYSVCLSAAILILCGRITPSLLSEDKVLINKWAFEAEKIFHGKPSGIDNSICTYGGALMFQNGSVTDVLSEMQHLHILLVDTQVPRHTNVLVTAVFKKKMAFGSVINPIMEAIHALAKECWEILKHLGEFEDKSKKMKELQDFIVMNQHLLNSLGVGHAKLNQIFYIAQKFSCPAKMTGAGGGGCAIIMIPPEIEAPTVDYLKKELESHDFKVWDLYLGQNGVEVKFQN